MSAKKTNKTAIIRGDDIRACPFGLPMTDACKFAGNSVLRMAPLDSVSEDDKSTVIDANKLTYTYHKDGERCPFADKILEVSNKVDCDFGDVGAGLHSQPFAGSPVYPHMFTGVGFDGLYGYPLGYYTDNNNSRNLFFGLFSYLGNKTVDEFIKLADSYDKSGDFEKAAIIDDLVMKLNSIRSSDQKSFDKIEKYLEEYRNNSCKAPDIIWELSDALNNTNK